MYDDAFTPLEPLDEIGEQTPPAYDPEAMLSQLDQSEVSLRMQAARAFCDLEDSRAIPRLVALLDDECPLVRVSAAYALGRNTAPEVVEPLIHCLQNDWNGYVRKGAVWALGNARDRRAIPVLALALATDLTAIRLWAASALGQMASAVAIAPLFVALTTDKAAVVRSNCAWALGRLLFQMELAQGTPEEQTLYAQATQSLIQAMQRDEDTSVRDDAQVALQKLQDEEIQELLTERELDPLSMFDL